MGLPISCFDCLKKQKIIIRSGNETIYHTRPSQDAQITVKIRSTNFDWTNKQITRWCKYNRKILYFKENLSIGVDEPFDARLMLSGYWFQSQNLFLFMWTLYLHGFSRSLSLSLSLSLTLSLSLSFSLSLYSLSLSCPLPPPSLSL